MNEITSTEMLAVNKVLKKAALDAARANMAVGTHEVNCLVRVSGSVKVGADYEKNVTASLPQKKMLLAALMLNGVCVEAFVKRYNDGEFEDTKEQEKKLDAIWKELADETSNTVNGTVTTKLTLEKVGDA